VLVPELLELNGDAAENGAIELVARLPERTCRLNAGQRAEAARRCTMGETAR
jgi:hypothetical protein